MMAVLYMVRLQRCVCYLNGTLTIYRFPEFPCHRAESYLTSYLFLTCYHFVHVVSSPHIAFRFSAKRLLAVKKKNTRVLN